MTDAEIVAEVARMVKDAATRPIPAGWVIDRLNALAVVAVYMTVATEGVASHNNQNLSMLVIIRAAYELGKQHGGLTLVVSDGEGDD